MPGAIERFVVTVQKHDQVGNRARGERLTEIVGDCGEVPDPSAVGTFESAVLSWEWPEGSGRAGVRRMYRELIAGRREWVGNRAKREARLVCDGTVLEVGRGVRVWFNLSGEEREVGRVEGRVVFSSEDRKYGGGRRVAFEGTLRPWECVVVG